MCIIIVLFKKFLKGIFNNQVYFINRIVEIALRVILPSSACKLTYVGHFFKSIICSNKEKYSIGDEK